MQKTKWHIYYCEKFDNFSLYEQNYGNFHLDKTFYVYVCGL